MSLTHELLDKTSAVRRFVDGHFVFQPLSRETNKIVKATTSAASGIYDEWYLYTVAGTATDLAIRSLFDLRIHKGSAVRSGIDMLGNNMNSYSDSPLPDGVSPWSNRVPFWREAAKDDPPPRTEALARAFEKFIDDRTFDDLTADGRRTMMRWCILFGRIDHFRRLGPAAVLFSLADLPLDQQLVGASTPALEADVGALGRGLTQVHAMIEETRARVAR